MISKTLLITGVAIDGIGHQVCKHILHVQRVARTPTAWRIILAQRDPLDTRSRAAYTQLKSLASTLQGRVVSYKCDLADFTSVRQCVAELKQQEEKIDVVMLNAGVVVNRDVTTADGYEATYQVNHLGHFLLLSLLQDMIRDRVVFVGSSLHMKADAQATLDSLENAARKNEGVSGMKQYGQAKLLTAYCLSHWHKVLSKKNVKVILASPGFVPATGLSRDNSWLARLAMHWVIHYLPMARTPQQAGMTLAALVCGEEWKDMDDCYIDADLKEQRMHEDVYNHEQADRVWHWSQMASKAQME